MISRKAISAWLLAALVWLWAALPTSAQFDSGPGSRAGGANVSGHCGPWTSPGRSPAGSAATANCAFGAPPIARGYTQNNTTGTSLALSFPTGTQTGDYGVIICSGANNTSTPSGWASPYAFVNGFWATQIYTKTLTAADIATGSVTITVGGSFQQIAVVGTFAPGAVIAAMDAHNGAVQGGGTAPGITTQSVGIGPGAFSPNTLWLLWVSARTNTAQSVSPGNLQTSQFTSSNGSASLYTYTFPVVALGQTLPIANFSNNSVSSNSGLGNLMLGIIQASR